MPVPPAGGLVIRGYCTYLGEDKSGKIVRAKQYYYKENPDRWAAETQSDMLWLTKKERELLVPSDPKVGSVVRVEKNVQQRFFSTIGIDYMEGSVNSLPVRDNAMRLTVTKVTSEKIHLQLDGYAKLGKELDKKARGKPNTRGCEIRALGHVTYNREKKAFERFDVVGIGKAWGTKRGDNRAIRVQEYPWTYGIACELVTGNSPKDLIPPYNLLHYGSAGPYFGKK